jgi:hypothetical protein
MDGTSEEMGDVPEDPDMHATGPSRMVKTIGKRVQQAWSISGPGEISQCEMLIPWPREGEVRTHLHHP